LIVFFVFRTSPASTGEDPCPETRFLLFQNDISSLLFLDVSGLGMGDVSHIFRRA